MKLVLTGGGTGGHIYPALEVGRLAAERGASLRYMGSLRGQEGAICAKLGIPFEGFGSEPLWSLKTPAGWRALIRLSRATAQAKQALRRDRADVVFSTGGYSAAPVMAAARSLGIPYVVHGNDTVPGRTVRMFAARAAAVTCTFRETERVLPGAIRTGHPIRKELREAAANREETPLILVIGGSQGARFLNNALPRAARHISGMRWLHATGPGQFQEFAKTAEGIPGYELVPYLEANQIADAYARAMLVVCRSGSTLAELAAFGLPSVLIPLPASADDHQLHNAREFASMGAAAICEQDRDVLADAIRGWVADPDRRAAARKALHDWDIPDATMRLATIIEKAAGKNA